MARGRYFLLAWRASDEGAVARQAARTERLEGEGGWRCAHTAPGLQIWVEVGVGPTVTDLGGAGVLVGESWPMPDAPAGLRLPSGPPREAARLLARQRWGRYVALLADPAEGGWSVYRDPSGLLEALTWRTQDGDHVVSGHPFDLPDGLRPPYPSLNWNRIAAYVGLLSAATTDPLFDGLSAVGPGELRALEAATPELIWRPSAFAGDPILDGRAAAVELVRRVDACTAALVEPHDKVLVAVSGGLDSAIVATSLDAVGAKGRVACWLNRVGDRIEGDERLYAHAVAAHIGVGVTRAAKPLTPLVLDDFTELGRCVWPAINGVDAARDRDELDRLSAHGATALVTGDGGDAVFLQLPHAAIWEDLRAAEGLRALGSPLLADVARRTRQSVWGVLAQARAVRSGRAPPLMPASRFATRQVRDAVAGVRHRWVEDAAEGGISAGKRLHVQAIANCHLFRGESRRARAADVVFPLLAQPVVELCLRLPTPILGAGAYDRAYTRAAFGHRLPELVRMRRSKGNMAGYFARLAAASLATLRPLLLDGCLSEAQVLDRAALEAALDPDQLLRGTRANELLILGAVEAWVRHWQGRMPDTPGAARQV